MNCIKQNTRPNLHKLTKTELIKILIQNDSDSDADSDIKYISENYSDKLSNFETFTRNELVDKIFELWSQQILLDYQNNSIECLICTDPLTNGNNLTFECGHKFHSMCVVKHLLCFSTDSYQNYLNDNEIKSTKIEYCCPQCKRIIDFVQCEKSQIT